MEIRKRNCNLSGKQICKKVPICFSWMQQWTHEWRNSDSNKQINNLAAWMKCKNFAAFTTSFLGICRNIFSFGIQEELNGKWLSYYVYFKFSYANIITKND